MPSDPNSTTAAEPLFTSPNNPPPGALRRMRIDSPIASTDGPPTT